MRNYITTIHQAIQALKQLMPDDNFIHLEDEEGNTYVWDSIKRKQIHAATGEWSYVMNIRKVDGCVYR